MTNYSLSRAHHLGINMQARAFLPVLLEMLQSQFDEDGWLERIRDVDVVPLFNGRERGYCLVLGHENAAKKPGFGGDCLHLYFAEDRNSGHFFLWHWEAPALPLLETPALGDDDSYRDRIVVDHLRFDLAEDKAREIILRWLRKVEPRLAKAKLA